MTTLLERENDLLSCSLNYAFYTIGGKWKPYIIWYLNCAENNTMHYGELKRIIPYKISHKMFAQQLKELEADGLITRDEYDDGVSTRIKYSISEKGKFIVPVILYMRDWGTIFGEEFPISSLGRTKGDWQGKTISYGYTSEADPNISVKIEFNVGIEKEEK